MVDLPSFIVWTLQRKMLLIVLKSQQNKLLQTLYKELVKKKKQEIMNVINEPNTETYL